MFKYLVILVIILLTILPVNAVDPCPTCPVQTPHIVYVTVTVTIPVPQTLPPTPPPTPIPTQEPNIITKSTGIPEYGIYGLLFLLLIGGVIFMKIKQKRQSKPEKKKILPEPSDKYGNLYEEDDDPVQIIEPLKPIIKEEPPKKPKKPKKPVSLLDRDFEF